MIVADNRVIRIGAWRVDPALDEISRDGTTVKLEPRAMRVLLCLAEHAGQVVSVDQLLDAVWKDVIVTPDSVYQAVAGLRRAFGDTSKEPAYIANVLRRGYRLVAPVAPWVDAASSSNTLERPAEAPIPVSITPATTHLRLWPWVILVVATAFTVVVVVPWEQRREHARNVLLPAIEETLAKSPHSDARLLDMALEAEKVLPHDHMLAKLWPLIATT